MRSLILSLLLPLTACASAPTPSPDAPAAQEARTEAAPTPKPAAATATGSYRDASIDDLQAVLPAAKLLDVRSPGEYERGHVAGARLLPVGDLPGRLDELEAWRGEEIWVICQSGGRSARAGKLLESRGFKVVNVQGGTGAWIAAGKPVE